MKIGRALRIGCAVFVCVLLAACGEEAGNPPAVSIPVPVLTAAPGPAGTEAAPETSGDDTAPETAYVFHPETVETVTFLRETGTESLLADIGAEDALLQARNARLQSESGITLAETLSENPEEAVGAGYLSGDGCELLLLRACPTGSKLMCAGVLQNLSAAGIGITARSSFAVSALTEDFSYGGKVYLLPFCGLCSDFRASAVLLGAARSDEVAALREAVINGTYSLPLLLELLREAEDSGNSGVSADDSFAASAFLLGAGGKVLRQDGAKGALPAAGVLSAEFEKAYGQCRTVLSYLQSGDALLELTYAADLAQKEGIALPLPPAQAGAEYCTPVSAKMLTVVAAPAGVVYGGKIAAVLEKTGAYSEELRNALSLPGDADGSVCKTLLSSAHAELAECYTWGDLYSFVLAGLQSGTEYGSLTAAKGFSDRLKAIGAAAEIIQSRLS